MTRQDDELVRRYQEASAQEDARPGVQVRDAVRAHAQMLAAASAAASAPATALPSRAAANQSRWKISALATVALVGLTGLLMLKFERGTPEERDIAFGQRRAQAPAPAAAPAPKHTAGPNAPGVQDAAPHTARDLPSPQPSAAAQEPAPAVVPAPAGPSAQATPPPPPAPAAPAPTRTAPAARPDTGTRTEKAERSAPATRESEPLTRPGADAAMSGFPASPPPTPPTPPTPATPPTPRAPAAPAPAAAEGARAELHERSRSATQDKSVPRAMTPPHAAPSHAVPPPSPSPLDQPPMARSLPGGNAASSDASAGAPQVQKALDPSLARALRDAARVGNAREVENLVNQGVPVDARDTAGRTALMIAALNGHTAAVQKLLALGAQTALVDGDGLTAAQHARRWGYGAIADLINLAR